jgi:transposase
MYVRVTATPKSPRRSVKVVESIREGLKVKQVMIHHVGIAADEAEIEKLKHLGREFIAHEQLKREQASGQLPLFPLETPSERYAQIEKHAQVKEQGKRGRKPKTTLQDIVPQDLISLLDLVEEQRIIEGVHDVAGHVYTQLGYDQLLPRQKDKDLLKDLVLMRLANPSSKLKAQQILDKKFARTHDLSAIYRLMDKLFPKIEVLKTATFNRTRQIVPETIDILFFDCTTLYFESNMTDELRQFGYSKDHRFNTTQVVLALATTSDGLPIGYELFEGNKAEVKTLLICLETWKKSFKIGSVCFVADRAMMSEENLKALDDQGYTYVVAAKLRLLPKTLQTHILAEEHYTLQSFGNHVGWIGEFTYKSRRLIVSYKADRARRDVHQRTQVIEKIRKRLGEEGGTQKLITNQGVKKFTTSENSKTRLDQKKIDHDAMWDGLHGIITNIKEPPHEGGETAKALLGRYHRLWKIEESFRLNKHTLSMRPIYHFTPERIKSHIALCYMAFSILRHMEYVITLTQKISPEVILDELMDVQASLLRHTPTGRLYRLPGRFSQTASKIYKAFRLTRKNHAQELVQI